MDNFTKYEEMRDTGSMPIDVYDAAKADGLDSIALIRLLRKVFGLSLVEAKRVCTVPDPFAVKQKLTPGETVYWEGWSTDEGLYLVQGRILDVVNGFVRVDANKKYRLNQNGLEEVPCFGPQVSRLPVRYFDKSLAERLGESLKVLQDLPKALLVPKTT